MDFVEICNIYVGKTISKAAYRVFNSDKICRSYSGLNFGVTFLDHSVVFSDISLTAILAGITPIESVKVRHSPLLLLAKI